MKNSFFFLLAFILLEVFFSPQFVFSQQKKNAPATNQTKKDAVSTPASKESTNKADSIGPGDIVITPKHEELNSLLLLKYPLSDQVSLQPYINQFKQGLMTAGAKYEFYFSPENKISDSDNPNIAKLVTDDKIKFIFFLNIKIVNERLIWRLQKFDNTGLLLSEDNDQNYAGLTAEQVINASSERVVSSDEREEFSYIPLNFTIGFAYMPQYVLATSSLFHGAEFNLRYFPISERLYLELTESVSLIDTTMNLLNRNDLELAYYFFYEKQAPFRVSIGLGGAGILNYKTTNYELAIMPLALSFEWHTTQFVFFIKTKADYSIGINPASEYNYGWHALASAGVLMKF